MVLLLSRDKTCYNCFCNNTLIDQVLYHYSGPVQLTFVKG